MTPYAFKNKDFLNVELRETWCLGVFVVFDLLNRKSLEGTKADEESRLENQLQKSEHRKVIKPDEDSAHYPIVSRTKKQLYYVGTLFLGVRCCFFGT